MSIKEMRNVFLWCALINYCVLLVWWLFFVLGPGLKYHFWSGWIHLSVEQFGLISLVGIMLYKIGILLFNVVPAIALHIVGSKSAKE